MSRSLQYAEVQPDLEMISHRGEFYTGSYWSDWEEGRRDFYLRELTEGFCPGCRWDVVVNRAKTPSTAIRLEVIELDGERWARCPRKATLWRLVHA